jgi:5-methylcytosine-specific restriction endonuclease McrA
MPYAPLNKECKEYGCRSNKTHRSAYCIKHGGGLTDKSKQNNKLYNQQTWTKIRQRQLSASPLCVRCKSNGKITAATTVDHVFPHRRDATAFRVNFFQALCTACHSLKTHDENKGKFLHYTDNGTKEYKFSDYSDLFQK